MAAQFESAVVTDAGRALIASSESTETALEFTSMASGSGIYTTEEAAESELKVRTALRSQQQSFPISSLKKPRADTVAIKSLLTNEGLYNGYNWNEAGIFAKLKGSSDTPILFCISVIPNDEGTQVPAYSSTTMISVLQTFYLKTDTASDVTILVNHDVCELLEDAGLNTELKTTEKGSLVGAINEVDCALAVKDVSVSASAATGTVEGCAYTYKQEVAWSGTLATDRIEAAVTAGSCNDCLWVDSQADKAVIYFASNPGSGLTLQLSRTRGVTA